MKNDAQGAPELVCVVVARNGEGDAWVFGSLPEARIHPIPQMDDVYATDGRELVAQYGRGSADSLLRFAEGRDRARLTDAFETWRSQTLAASLPPEMEQLVWDKILRAAKKPPRAEADIVRIVVEDRAAREGRTLRSLPGSEARSALPVNLTRKRDANMTTEEKSRARVPDNSKITIATEGGKNPKREGTPSAERFALYKNGMTVAEAKAAGIKAADISYDSGKGFITLTEAPVEKNAAE